MLRHIFRLELQRIAAACDKVGLYEARSDICDGDREMAHPCLLRQAFQIMVLESLGGRVGRGCTETFGSGDGSDTGNAEILIGMVCLLLTFRNRKLTLMGWSRRLGGKSVECRIHHSCESQAVGFQGFHFLFYIQRIILPANA